MNAVILGSMPQNISRITNWHLIYIYIYIWPWGLCMFCGEVCSMEQWVGIGGFSKVVATFNHVWVLNSFVTASIWDVWIIPYFFNLGLCAACWAHFMCHHELWPTSVSHPSSFLNISLGLAGGKHYQKIVIPLFGLVLPNVAIPGHFPYIIFYHYLFSLVSSGWLVIPVCVSISIRELS